MKSKAIYAGSFDPITNGHLDIIDRARSLFSNVIIAVIENPEKTPVFSIEERIKLIRSLFKGKDGIEVAGFAGLLVDFAKQNNVTTMVRGLRAMSDFEYEFQMSLTNRKLYPEMDTIFLMTDFKYSYLSSSLVRQLAKYGGDISGFVPSEVQIALEAKTL